PRSASPTARSEARIAEELDTLHTTRAQGQPLPRTAHPERACGGGSRTTDAARRLRRERRAPALRCARLESRSRAHRGCRSEWRGENHAARSDARPTKTKHGHGSTCVLENRLRRSGGRQLAARRFVARAAILVGRIARVHDRVVGRAQIPARPRAASTALAQCGRACTSGTDLLVRARSSTRAVNLGRADVQLGSARAAGADTGVAGLAWVTGRVQSRSRIFEANQRRAHDSTRGNGLTRARQASARRRRIAQTVSATRLAPSASASQTLAGVACIKSNSF